MELLEEKESHLNSVVDYDIEECLVYKPTPKKLFDTLNALPPNRVIDHIHLFCFPGSLCYENIEKIKDSDNVEAPEAYLCYALMTSDITKLDKGALGNLCAYFKEKYPESSLNESFRWIYTLLHTLDKPIILKQTLKSINQEIPCYMNYSGLDFSALKPLEKINFSYSNSRNTTFYLPNLIHCNFSYAVLSDASLIGITGYGCQFDKAIFDNTQFFQDQDTDSLERTLNSAETLHTFLERSKGIDTIKRAIQKNIINMVDKNIQNIELRTKTINALFNEPLFAEHRNLISGGFNKMLSCFKKDVIKTTGQKILIERRTNTLDDVNSEFENVHVGSRFGFWFLKPFNAYQTLATNNNESNADDTDADDIRSLLSKRKKYVLNLKEEYELPDDDLSRCDL